MTSIILTELSNPHVLVIVVHLFVHFCREAINLELISSQLSDMMQTLHGNFKRRYPSLHMPSIFLNISSRVDTKEKSPNLTLKIERSSLCHISSVGLYNDHVHSFAAAHSLLFPPLLYIRIRTPTILGRSDRVDIIHPCSVFVHHLPNAGITCVRGDAIGTNRRRSKVALDG